MNQTPETDPFEELLGLDRMRNFWGKLTLDIRRRLLAVVRSPTDATWNNAYSIILRHETGLNLTLWQAWIATDPGALQTGPTSTLHGRREKWTKVPTQEQLFNALRYAATAAPGLRKGA